MELQRSQSTKSTGMSKRQVHDLLLGDSDNLIFTIPNKPQLTGSANFAIENQDIGELKSGQYTQTFTDGGGSVTFNSSQSGSTRVIASSGTSQDTLNVTVFPEPAPTNVTANITELDLDEEYVKFNYTGKPVSTEGWKLHDEGQNYDFTFPRQILTSSDTVVITTNKTAESAVPDTDYRFNWSTDAYIWNNGGDIATLLDADGTFIDDLEK
ncbi:lamin tail domain-containing protein [Halovenus salina]|uniref:Lamin tail domain-containing protein n=2 Tax=Halovenus salina TaxID=1510225 RepID=A0ABD5W8B7_9EURY